jgi:lipopolysaccharide biosynthesis protein
MDRAAIVTHYSRSPVLSRSLITLITELRAHGYEVVMSSACEADAALDWRGAEVQSTTTIVRKPNVGYDFGSAAVALDLFPQLAMSRRVLVVNDSNVGPFRALDEVIDNFEGSGTDAWALTSSGQHGYHLQSFFLGFSSGVLREPTLRGFWREIRHVDRKDSIVKRYEVGLSALLEEEGFSVRSMFSPASFDAAPNANLSTAYWLDLLIEGYPFVKRSFLQSSTEANALASAAVRSLFGEDLAAWT